MPRRADPVKPDAMALEPALEDTPDESAVRTAALQCEADKPRPPLCGRRPVGAPRRLDRLTRSTSCLLPIGAPARLAGAPVVRRECTEPYWRPEMPRGYDAEARRLSRLRRHGNLSRAQDGGISIRGTLRECRRSIPPRGDRNSSGARRRLARVPPSSGA